MVCKVCLKFPKFTSNLAYNCELRNEVVKVTPNFVGIKLQSEVHIIQCSWFGNVTTFCTNEFKHGEKNCQPSKAYFMMFPSEM